MSDDFLYRSVLARPGHIDRNGEMIGYGAMMTVNGETREIDGWTMEPMACPFSIIDEFDQWFEWWKRVEFYGEPRMTVTADMLGLVNAASRQLNDRIAREVFSMEGHFLHGVGFLNTMEATASNKPAAQLAKYLAHERFGAAIDPPRAIIRNITDDTIPTAGEANDDDGESSTGSRQVRSSDGSARSDGDGQGR